MSNIRPDPFVFIRKRLIAWYRKNARGDLPWRRTRDPYRIWVSEAMLQQTQVATVIPHYHRFLKRFPTVGALAKAPVEEVLEAWSGLGYYHRAKNLYTAAQKILKEHHGKIPSDPNRLRELPGVGRYMAGAIASIAFDRPAPILEANVTRVLTRLLGIRQSTQDRSVQRTLWRVSEDLVRGALPGTAHPEISPGTIHPGISPRTTRRRVSPGTINQATMELGQLICKKDRPLCISCPLRPDCRAFRLGLQHRIPIRKPTPLRKKVDYLCGILQRGGAFLLARRPLMGLLPGLWEFPGGEKQNHVTDRQSLIRTFYDRLGIKIRPYKEMCRFRQILTHRELRIRAFRVTRLGGRLRPRWYIEARWIPKDRLRAIAFTAGMLKVMGQVGQ